MDLIATKELNERGRQEEWGGKKEKKVGEERKTPTKKPLQPTRARPPPALLISGLYIRARQ